MLLFPNIFLTTFAQPLHFFGSTTTSELWGYCIAGQFRPADQLAQRGKEMV